jgi:hypothetical protein
MVYVAGWQVLRNASAWLDLVNVHVIKLFYKEFPECFWLLQYATRNGKM